MISSEWVLFSCIVRACSLGNRLYNYIGRSTIPARFNCNPEPPPVPRCPDVQAVIHSPQDILHMPTKRVVGVLTTRSDRSALATSIASKDDTKMFPISTPLAGSRTSAICPTSWGKSPRKNTQGKTWRNRQCLSVWRAPRIGHNEKKYVETF